ncbi:transposase [Azoarcus sp. KH32C]|uniref:Mu transposase domain-containing protein n=1 Tax=Azoarcus sp. KH32C TaxID=748247 RepID=UPI0002385BB8|nr:transposase [Azoarcus sp. KH32C]BAL27307.1 transposase [Azoarcus sp. KH32C]
MRTVVLGTVSDADGKRRPKLNSTFADHWSFTPRLCRPYRAQTKGKVESGVKYAKRNFVPGRTFADLDDFNQQLAGWQAEVADQRIHGTTHQRPIGRFADDWLVSIDGNRYSVPFGLIGQTVEVVRAGGSWLIRHRGRLVAELPVLADRAQLSVCPQHGPGAVMRNARKHHVGPAAASEPADGLWRAPDALRVEIRDLALYDILLQAGAFGDGAREVA